MATVSEQEQRKSLIEQFKEVRARTLELVKTLEKDDFVVQTAPYMSPPKWHIGHVSWVFEAILSKIEKNYEFFQSVNFESNQNQNIFILEKVFTHQC